MPEDAPWLYDAEEDDGRSPSHRFAETMHTDESGKVLSFPHQGTPSKGQAAAAAALPLLATPAGGAVVRGGLGYLAGETAEAMGMPGGTGEVLSFLTGGGGGMLKNLAKKGIGKLVEQEMRKRSIKEAMGTAAGEAVETSAPKVVGSGATEAAKAAATSGRIAQRARAAAEALPDETQRIVMELQKQMGTESGRAAIREFLKTQPPAVASQIKDLLARGLSAPATVRTGAAKAGPAATAPDDIEAMLRASLEQFGR